VTAIGDRLSAIGQKSTVYSAPAESREPKAESLPA